MYNNTLKNPPVLKRRFFKLPNRLFSLSLKPVDLLVYVAVLSLQKGAGQPVIASGEQIGNQCGLHRNTVNGALSRLCAHGIIEKQIRFTKDGRYAANGYKIKETSGKFTMLPACLLSYGLSPTQFAVYCFLCRCANHAGKAFPSLRKISKTLGICVNTVLAALTRLDALGLLQKAQYRRMCGCFGCNNYRLCEEENSCSGVCPVVIPRASSLFLCQYQEKKAALHVRFFLFAVLTKSENSSSDFF